MRQGVAANAGARSVVLRNVTIDTSSEEGVVVCGEQQNAATRQQALYSPDDLKSTDAVFRHGKKVSEQERAIAEEKGWNGRLTLTMSDCFLAVTGRRSPCLSRFCARSTAGLKLAASCATEVLSVKRRAWAAAFSTTALHFCTGAPLNKREPAK